MLQRTFSPLRRDVSAVGFGTWPLGGIFSIAGNPLGRGEVPEDRADATLHYALENGITFFDTADIYGAGRAEEIIGQATEESRGRTMLCTKFGNRIVGGRVIQDFTKSWLEIAVEWSCTRLKTSRIDVLLFHSPPDGFDWQGYDRAPLEKLVSAGRIGCYGVSCRSFQGAKMVMQAGFGSVIEVIYNAIDRRAAQIFEMAQRFGYAVIARMPLAYGLLTYKAGMSFGPDDHRSSITRLEREWIASAAERLAFLNELPGGMPVSAIRFVLSDPRVTVVIPGMHRPEHVSAALDAGMLGPLPYDVIQDITDAVPDVFPGWGI